LKAPLLKKPLMYCHTYQQVNQILKYVEKLNEIDTEGIEPLSHSMDLVNVMRDDVEKKSLSQEEALKNAPLRHWP